MRDTRNPIFERRYVGAALALLFLAIVIIPFEDRWAGSAMRHMNRLLRPLEELVDIGSRFGEFWGIFLLVILMLCLDRERWQRAVTAALGSSLAGLLASTLKFLIRRQRPAFDRRADFVRELPVEECGRWFLWPKDFSFSELFDQSYTGFPSGHSTAAAFLATCLSYYYPKGRIIWWALAVLTMIRRFERSRHYLGDILAGAALGILLFILVLRTDFILKTWNGIAGYIRAKFCKGAEG